MSATFKLRIVTPESDFYSGEIEYLCIDTPDGKQGIMRGALPRVIVLSKGRIEIKTSVVDTVILCGDGLVYVSDDGVTILSENCRYEDGDEEVEIAPHDDRTLDTAKAKIAMTVGKMKKTNKSKA